MNLLLIRTGDGSDVLPVLPRIRPPVDPGRTPSTYWQQIRQRVKEAYDKLKERLSHEERICSGLRRVEELNVIHPTAMTAQEAEKKLRDFLNLGYSKHRKWFWIDAVLAVLGVALAWVPGPNIFFFYPAARALSHHFAKSGAERALSLPWSYQEEPLLDRVGSSSGDPSDFGQAITTLEQLYDIDSLQTQLRAQTTR